MKCRTFDYWIVDEEAAWWMKRRTFDYWDSR